MEDSANNVILSIYKWFKNNNVFKMFDISKSYAPFRIIYRMCLVKFASDSASIREKSLSMDLRV